jgi:pimeloyl-ACP methyl ester carboxylesterase
LSPGTRFEEIAAAFVDVLDALNIKSASIYGHHTGNKIAASMAVGFPDHVKRLFFVGQSHSIIASNAIRANTVGKTRRKLLHAVDDREAALVHWADLFNKVSAEWWPETLVRNISDSTVRTAVITTVVDELMSSASMPSLYQANYSYDLERDLRQIVHPTLVIEIASPAEDQAIGRQGESLCSLMRNATVSVIEEPDRHGNTLEHRAKDLAALVKQFMKAC